MQGWVGEEFGFLPAMPAICPPSVLPCYVAHPSPSSFLPASLSFHNPHTDSEKLCNCSKFTVEWRRCGRGRRHEVFFAQVHRSLCSNITIVFCSNERKCRCVGRPLSDFAALDLAARALIAHRCSDAIAMALARGLSWTHEPTMNRIKFMMSL